MKTLTYGILPSFDKFATAFDSNVGTGGEYEIHCPDNSTDARMLSDTGTGLAGRYCDDADGCDMWLTVERLYSLLDSLCAINDRHVSHGEPWSDEQMEWAGDFASSILTTLGFEWV